ncbi:MAG: DNA polymerase I [bacterium]
MAETFYIVDGNSFAYRAFYGMPPLTDHKGNEVHAVLGFYNMILRILKGKNPEYFAIAFDHHKPTFRHKMFEAYKAHREKMPESLQAQMKMIKAIATSGGIKNFEFEGYEADDIIGSIAALNASENLNFVIMTGDKDMIQVLNENVSMMKISKGVEVITTPETLKASAGIVPEQILDILALMGDAADNIPGVKGIGEKTAYKLIHEYGTAENVIKNVDKIKQEKLKQIIKAGIKDIEISKLLAKLKIDKEVIADTKFLLEECQSSLINYAGLNAEFLEYDFKSLVTDKKNITIAAEKEENIKEAQWVDSFEEIEGFAKAEKVTLIFCGSENDNELILIKVSGREKYYCLSGMNFVSVPTTKADIITNSVKDVFRFSPEKPSGKIFDLSLMSYLLNPEKNYKDISFVYAEYLNKLFLSFDDVAGKGAKKIDPSMVPAEELNKYVYSHLAHAEALAKKLFEKIEENKLEEIYTDMELPLAVILADMEKTGIRIDTVLLEELIKKTEKNIAAEEKKIFKEAGVEFNINSPKQLGEVLFEKLKLPTQKKNKTGYSTDAEVLDNLADLHPAVASILTYRTLVKLKTGFLDAIKEYSKKDGMLYPLYNQTVAATGRLSSSKPNIQNIPVRGEEGRELRKIFIPLRNGDVIVKADYSQIELRVLAHCAKEKKMIQAFDEAVDIHEMTAREVFDVMPGMVDKDMRRVAKTINFGIVYGISPYGLAKQLKVSNPEAKRYIDKFFAMFPGVRLFHAETIAFARKNGYVETIFGRKRFMANINSSNRTIREFAERASINAPIQGTAADIIKKAMIAVFDYFEAHKMKAKMVLQVHDELVISAPEKEAAIVEKILKEKMEAAANLAVPMTVTISRGKNWYE